MARGFLWSALLLVVGLVAAVFWILTTAGGARFAIDQTLPRLPVDAVVGEVGGRLIGPLRLDNVVVSSDTFQVSVDRLELEWKPMALIGRKASVDRLALFGVRGRLDLEALESADVDTAEAVADTTAGSSPFEIEIRNLSIEDLDFDVPGIGRLTQASLTGSGGIGDAQIELEGGADLRPIGGPRSRISLVAAGWLTDADIELDAVLEADADLPIPPGRVRVMATGAVDSAIVTLIADTESGSTPFPPMHLELEASGSLDSADVQITADTESGSSVIPPMHLELEANGSLDSADVSVTADTRTGTTPIPPSHVELQASGGLDGYRLTATILASGTEALPPIDVTFAGTGDDEGFDVETAIADVLDGQVRFAGSVEWEPELRWVADLEVDSVAPASLTPEPEEWPGRLSFRGESTGRVTGEQIEAAVRIDTIGGHLRGSAVSGRVVAEAVGDVIDVETLRLDWGSLDLDASGRIADSVDLAFDLNAPDLAVVAPDAAGSVRTSGSVSGRLEAPVIDLAFDVADLRTDVVSVARATGKIDLDLAAPEGGSLDVSARTIAFGMVDLDSLEVRLLGTDEGHELRVAGTGPDGELELVLAGRQSGEGSALERTWDGRIAALAFDIPPAGAWTLTQPVALVLSADSVRLATLCLAATDREGRMCGAADWYQPLADGLGHGTAELDLIDIELGRLDTLLAIGGRVEGGVSGTIRAELAPGGGLTGAGSITLGPGMVETVQNGKMTRVLFGGPGIEFSAGAEGLAVSLGLDVEREDTSVRAAVEGDLRAPGYTNVHQPWDGVALEGSLRANMPDLAFIEALLPELKNTKGSATIDLAIGGTLGDPNATGEVAITGVETDVPDLGIQLRGVELTGRSEAEGVLVVHGQLTSGGGTIEIDGQSPLVPSEANPTTLTIRGERFTAVNTGSMQVEISPNLDLSITRDLVVVRGDVVVPSATIEFIEVPESAVRPSRDVVFIGDTLEAVSPVKTDADVTLTLGNEVFFRGFGLSSRLQGQLRIQERPGSATRATGEIQLLNGRYTAFGQNLEINPGRLVFNGPADNPGLDLTARRTTPDGTEAGLRVGGTVKTPDIEVFSTPAKSQSDALSYLLFGRPLNETSGSDQGQVGNAAAVIGGSMLATTLGQSVGLDEARIETGANPNEASLVAGKYLSPQLYVAYGIGLYDRASIFRIRYLITGNWTIQVETGRHNSADILYRIERG